MIDHKKITEHFDDNINMDKIYHVESIWQRLILRRKNKQEIILGTGNLKFKNPSINLALSLKFCLKNVANMAFFTIIFEELKNAILIPKIFTSNTAKEK